MVSSAFRLSLLLVLLASLSLSGCGGVPISKSALDEGVFVLNSRNLKDTARVEFEGEKFPAEMIGFGDLEASPQLRFRGRLTKVGGKVLDGNRIQVKNIQTMSEENFHAQGEEKQRLVEQGILEADEQTFGEAVADAKSLLIYVHGFNNSASDAAKFTMVLKGFLAEQSCEPVMMFYTWPTAKDMVQVAAGGLTKRLTLGAIDAPLNDVYLGDRKNIDLAAHSLNLLYQELEETYPHLKTDIIAHSMGSEVVLKSLYMFHYHCLVEKHNPEVIRRVVLVGADVGLDTFRIMAKPTESVAEQVLVYINPRDAVLSQSADINSDARLGAVDPNELPGISSKFTFLKLRDPIPVRPVEVVRSLLVNHNPIRDSRIMRHACRFICSGDIVEPMPELRFESLNGDGFRGSGANYHEVYFEEGKFVDALSATVTKPVQSIPVIFEGAGTMIDSAIGAGHAGNKSALPPPTEP